MVTITDLTSPALVLDKRALCRNIKAMADHCQQQQIRLRPHVKSHKCSEIAKLQYAHGASHFCCARISEAKVIADTLLADPNIDLLDILITSPVVDELQLQSFLALANTHKTAQFHLVVDNSATAQLINRLATQRQTTASVFMDLDVGTRRTGVRTDQRADAFVKELAELPSIELAGIQAYAGHQMHLSTEQRQQESENVHGQINNLLERWRSILDPSTVDSLLVSGGGTGTWDIDGHSSSPFTELQAGSYVFMDRDYRDAVGYEGVPFVDSLFVYTRVISQPSSRVATVDAGLKAMATDSGPARVVSIAGVEVQHIEYIFTGDEHGGLIFPEGSDLPPIGAQVVLQIPHCDPTVNLYNHMAVIDEQRQYLWQVDARGYMHQHTE